MKCQACQGRGYTVYYVTSGEKEIEKCMWCHYE